MKIVSAYSDPYRQHEYDTLYHSFPEGCTGRSNPRHMGDMGYTVDDKCYPWFAYKGPRFNPTEYAWCYTDLEQELIDELKKRMRRTYE